MVHLPFLSLFLFIFYIFLPSSSLSFLSFPPPPPSLSVRLWNQHGVDLTKLKWERHRVGVTYHPISDDFFESDVDALVRTVYMSILYGGNFV